MDSAALLDLLGNENRRRILRLLAHKPCYVTEISEELEVSPKAVIDHLSKLEEAGLVTSRVDEGRRKYFQIARDLRLEVSVSPYRFGAKSAFPGRGFDITRCRHVSIDIDTSERTGDARDRTGTDRGPREQRETTAESENGGDRVDPAALAARLDRLDELEDELSLAQRWVQARLTETIERVGAAVGNNRDERLYAEVLLAVQDGADSPETVAEATGIAPTTAREALAGLAEAGFLEREGGRWTVVG